MRDMEPYAQREEKARLDLIQECGDLELELFRNELGGIGVGVGTQIKKQKDGVILLNNNYPDTYTIFIYNIHS